MDSALRNTEQPAWFARFAEIRADSYMLLAQLLTQPPGERLIKILRDLRWDEDIPANLSQTLHALRAAACDGTEEELTKEFARLFENMGCGTLQPCGSWYREKNMQSRSLAVLRRDLMRLGIVKKDNFHDTEDHAGALCEVMAILAGDACVHSGLQANFLHAHLLSWMPAFFRDLQTKTAYPFYRAVGLFGLGLLETENEYLRAAISGEVQTAGGTIGEDLAAGRFFP
ncbi:MAG: molecular chaperone TorD family protein [Smithellaceae bacterium]|nr:molecular chaperone TorD family protein [Smithellaceae bacterium]